MNWPAAITWAAMICAGLSRGPMLLYLFNIAACFGTLQMVPGQGDSGLNVVPQVVCAAILVGKILVQRGNLIRILVIAIRMDVCGILTAFLIYSILTALVLPRLFEGQIPVVPISGMLLGPLLIAPTVGNFTQPAYLTLSVVTALTFCVIGAHSDFRHHYIFSVLAGGVALIATGLLDVLTSAAGLGSLLDPFRTASYTLFTDNEVLGTKRVVGLMSEASAYGASCVTAAAALTFLRPCFASRWRTLVLPLVIASLLLMAAFSTSSSAYIGLGVFFVAFCTNWMIRFTSPHALRREELHYELIVVMLAAFILLCVVIISPTVLDPVVNMLNVIIFEKSSSDSYFVRSMWTRVAWEAFFSTHFLGVGFGGLRTSNWFVSILGSTGIFGGLLMFGFMIRAHIWPIESDTPAEKEMKRALRFALLPWLVMNWFSGTIPDIGVTAASFYGVILATHRSGKAKNRDALSYEAG